MVNETEAIMPEALRRVALEEKPVLELLLEDYLRELDGYKSAPSQGRQRFGYRYLDLYWTEAGRHPFFILIDHARAGFVLVNRFAYSKGIDYSIAEFFIARERRGAGAGRRAAFATFKGVRGNWEVRTGAGNELAARFWRSVIAEYTSGCFAERTSGRGDWTGPIWTFANKG